MNTVQELLKKIHQELKALETAKNLYSEQLAPSFRVFDYIKTDELGISKIIADLLNPQGSHAQKSLFLDKFMQVCLSSLSENGQWHNFVNDKMTVNIEESTKHGRRMDIYLTNLGRTHGICIENKPYANDQENQMNDYAIELAERHNDNYHLVYLSEYGEPSEYSVKEDTYQKWQKDNKVTWLKFSELIPWLTACKTDCQNASVIEFINQFIKFIQIEFMGVEDMSEEKTIVEMMLTDTDSISSSIAINRHIATMKTNLMNKLVDDIKKSLHTENNYRLDSSKIDYDKKWHNSYIAFIIENSDLQIHFQFDRTGFNNPFIAIRIGDDISVADVSRCQSIYDVISQHFDSVNSNQHWCAWYYFKPFDWSLSEAWETIYKGEMADNILAEVEKLYLVLADNDLLKL